MSPPQPSQEPTSTTCTPCRGTGRLISGLGGNPHEVICPWCRGTGERIPGIDAQQAPAEGGAPAAAPEGAASDEE